MTITMPFKNGCQFNSHLVHNPSCDILEGYIDKDTTITYGIYVEDYKDADGGIIKKGTEFCEYYSGENYNVGSKKKSYSRMWYADAIPVKYKALWTLLRSLYQEMPTIKKYKEL